MGHPLNGEPGVFEHAPKRAGVVGVPVVALASQTARPVRPHEQHSTGDEDATQLVQALGHLRFGHVLEHVVRDD